MSWKSMHMILIFTSTYLNSPSNYNSHDKASVFYIPNTYSMSWWKIGLPFLLQMPWCHLQCVLLLYVCTKKYQITFHRKLLAFYVAYSDKTIDLNLFLHHEPNGSTKGKLSNRNQETNICLYLYPGTCTQVHVWLNVLLFIPLLYYMLHFCCFFFFSM